MSRSLLLFITMLCAAAQSMAAEAGRLVFVAGQAQLASRPAALQQAVQEGDELSTGADGYIYMKTVDSGFLILRPNSRARVVAYQIDPVDPQNTHVKFELLKGVARSISGLSVKQARQNFRFNTPVAAIGVRGTDFIVHTNEQTSWVSVVSGGVVVSAFAGGCGPEGGGPCEGSSSRELFAGRPNVSLQVERGQAVPQLLHNSVIAPELNAPARSDEPVGKVGAATVPVGVAPMALHDISLDAAKSLVKPVIVPESQNGGNNGGTTTPPPVVVVVPEQPVVVKSVPEVLWGRWQAVAGVQPDPAVTAKLKDGSYDAGVIVGDYVVARQKNYSFVMPREGKVSFAMVDSESTLQKAGGPATAAQIQNARLEVDFGSRSFATSLTVSNEQGLLNFNAKGDVTQQGGLEGNILSSSRVRGYLGGAKADEAVYTFKGSNMDLTAAGVVRWSR